MSLCRMILIVVVTRLALPLTPTDAAQPSDLQRQAEEHRRSVEAHQREVRRRIEAARRSMKGSSSFRHTPAPPLSQSSAPEPPERTRQKFEYTFNDGKTFTYVFLLQLTDSKRKQYISGVAEFKPVGESGGTWEFLVRDNIQQVRSLDVAMSRPADRTMMLRRTMHVGDDGREPDVDENLPALLGNIEDWFFPPIPRYATEERSLGHAVVLSQFTGDWTSFGRYDKQDHSTIARYEWSIEPKGLSGGVLTVHDKRTFRRNDGLLELTGNGSFTFDTRRGVLQRRSFRGQLKEFTDKTNVAIDIAVVDPAKLAKKGESYRTAAD